MKEFEIIETFDCSAQRFFETIYIHTDFMDEYHRRRKDEEVAAQEWVFDEA
jgi:hypothetical protein